MDEVERLAGAKGAQVLLHAFGWDLGLQSLQPGEDEDGVIQILLPDAIQPPAIGTDLSKEKVPHEISRFAEGPRSQSRHLQHFQAQAHSGSKTSHALAVPSSCSGGL